MADGFAPPAAPHRTHAADSVRSAVPLVVDSGQICGVNNSPTASSETNSHHDSSILRILTPPVFFVHLSAKFPRMFVMLEAATESARAWTAPAPWRFDPAPTITSARSNHRTIQSHYPFITSVMQNETAPRLRHSRPFHPPRSASFTRRLSSQGCSSCSRPPWSPPGRGLRSLCTGAALTPPPRLSPPSLNSGQFSAITNSPPTTSEMKLHHDSRISRILASLTSGFGARLSSRQSAITWPRLPGAIIQRVFPIDPRFDTDPFRAPKAQPLVSPGHSEPASGALGKPPGTVFSPIRAQPPLVAMPNTSRNSDASSAFPH